MGGPLVDKCILGAGAQPATPAQNLSVCWIFPIIFFFFLVFGDFFVILVDKCVLLVFTTTRGGGAACHTKLFRIFSFTFFCIFASFFFRIFHFRGLMRV